MSELAARDCTSCKGGIPPLKGEAIENLLHKLGRGWQVIDQHHLEKEYRFRDFRQALNFTNRVGELAEAVGHHPDIYLTWGKVRLVMFTHSIDGLHESDFIFAAKADTLYDT